VLKAQWLWRSTRDGRGARRKYEDFHLLHRYLPAAAPGCVHVRPPVRDDDDTFGPPSRTASSAPISARAAQRRRRRRRWHGEEGARHPGPEGQVLRNVFRSVLRRILNALAAAAAAAVGQLSGICHFGGAGAQLGSSVAFGSGCGQALPGVPRKTPLCSCDLPSQPLTGSYLNTLVKARMTTRALPLPRAPSTKGRPRRARS